MENIPEQVDGKEMVNDYPGIWLGSVIQAGEEVAHRLGFELD